MVGRKKNGQFDSGNRLQRNGGRKPRADEEQIKAALDKAMPKDDVLKKLAAAIDAGEAWAITLYLAYMWGKPVERQEHDVNGAILWCWDDSAESDDSIQPTPGPEGVSP